MTSSLLLCHAQTSRLDRDFGQLRRVIELITQLVNLGVVNTGQPNQLPGKKNETQSTGTYAIHPMLCSSEGQFLQIFLATFAILNVKLDRCVRIATRPDDEKMSGSEGKTSLSCLAGLFSLSRRLLVAVRQNHQLFKSKKNLPSLVLKMETLFHYISRTASTYQLDLNVDHKTSMEVESRESSHASSEGNDATGEDEQSETESGASEGEEDSGVTYEARYHQR
eukprot:CAMPEP_0170192898 /NCGR_PEP_ID=MMETSP0040_2-20121228/55520_1 /TAXON_ID=641309 /ORGANISM="Lotharella oceanica, Strain CCMP622" /LENGTH=222 /DNA_ID=CAMNT_0010441379 /DNA_START=122 /DNA_END=790 /DNA_ORIENTATION=-